MNAHETEIRRHANGSIDIDHYIARCHRRRSLAAHAAIARFVATVQALTGTLFARKPVTETDHAAPAPREKTARPERTESLYKAA